MNCCIMDLLYTNLNPFVSTTVLQQILLTKQMLAILKSFYVKKSYDKMPSCDKTA